MTVPQDNPAAAAPKDREGPWWCEGCSRWLSLREIRFVTQGFIDTYIWCHWREGESCGPVERRNPA